MAARFVWLASYPRSGNTWMRMMLRSLYLDGGQVQINDYDGVKVSTLSRNDIELFARVKASELTPAELAELAPAAHRLMAQQSMEALLLRKVHDRCSRTPLGVRTFPPEYSLGAIYFVRDPRDVCVSLAHFFGTSLERAVEMLCDTKASMAESRHTPSLQLPQPMGTWSDHAESWLDHAGMPVLPVRYEDTLADPARELRRVAEFLGLAADAVDRAAEAASFAVLRRQEDAGTFREKPASAAKFFRSGKSGEGKQELSAGQLEVLETTHAAMMQRLGYL